MGPMRTSKHTYINKQTSLILNLLPLYSVSLASLTCQLRYTQDKGVILNDFRACIFFVTFLKNFTVLNGGTMTPATPADPSDSASLAMMIIKYM